MRLDRLPKENALEGLQLLREAWCEADVAMYLADWYKKVSKTIFLLQLLTVWAMVACASLANSRDAPAAAAAAADADAVGDEAGTVRGRRRRGLARAARAGAAARCAAAPPPPPRPAAAAAAASIARSCSTCGREPRRRRRSPSQHAQEILYTYSEALARSCAAAVRGGIPPAGTPSAICCERQRPRGGDRLAHRPRWSQSILISSARRSSTAAMRSAAGLGRRRSKGLIWC